MKETLEDVLARQESHARERLKATDARHAQAEDADAITDALVDALASLERRLEALEQQLSERGLNDLAAAIERRIVSRMRYGRNPSIERLIK